ncbi:MAG TPA: PhzF family phenazine biosynthesis protein [Acidocella sp.]|nr:MAG: phenazine biosynthesis protein PhzF [Rhodospirillales bacterium 20-64-7]HQT38767.1 PhzF family phenazine biosynthesis protein [Acidocella sp.]
MQNFKFQQVDVFSSVALKGNPLAVVVGADGLSDERMASFANWTNLSETTFLLKPTRPQADYRVRIFTPKRELPFAGHPTLGSCHVWLSEHGAPQGDVIVQECEAGLVRIQRDGTRLAFAAPPLRRSGPVEPELLHRITSSLGVLPREIVASNWVANGPDWVAVMLAGRDEVLRLKPDFAAMAGLEVGVIAPWRDGEAQFEVRAFAPGDGVTEDAVTGSLNAGMAQWLIGAGLAPPRYVAAQGTVLGRAGRVHVCQQGSDIWIGGEVVSCVTGLVSL